MKKEMLKHNVIFYGIQYSLSLFYAGMECEEVNLPGWQYALSRKDYFVIEYMLQFFALSVIYLILMLIGRRIYREREYCTGKSYYTMAAVTLAYSALICALWYARYNNSYVTITSKLDLIYPAVMAFFSVVIAAFYIACAVKTAMENKKIRAQEQS